LRIQDNEYTVKLLTKDKVTQNVRLTNSRKSLHFSLYETSSLSISFLFHHLLTLIVSTGGYALSTGAPRHFTPTAGPADLEVQAGLHSLVSDGVVEGTEVLVIDPDKCIHCNECEEAGESIFELWKMLVLHQ
jgi:NAD-dependent dihydropyrimidine dehydrogenase PreA subunit